MARVLKIFIILFALFLINCGDDDDDDTSVDATPEIIPGETATIRVNVTIPENQIKSNKPATVHIVLNGFPDGPEELSAEYGPKVETDFKVTPGEKLTLTVELYDINGNLIMQGTSLEFDLADGDDKEISVLVSELGKHFNISKPWSEAGFGHTATPIEGDKVVFIGGSVSAEAPASPTGQMAPPALYDHSNLSVCIAGDDGCEVSDDPLARRVLHTATHLTEGKIFVFGGYDENGNLISSPALYDSIEDTWSEIDDSNAPSPRAGHRATLLNDDFYEGKVLITGGLTGAGASSDAFIYDPVGEGFEQLGDMVSSHAFHTATNLANALGEVLITGGIGSEGIPVNGVELFRGSGSDDVERMFAGLETLSEGYQETLSSARSFHAAARLDETRVLICGGHDGEKPLNTCDLYNSEIGKIGAIIEVAAAMIFSRYGLTITALQSGAILISGGMTENNGFKTVLTGSELFTLPEGSHDILKGAFIAGDDSAERAFHRSTVLTDGRVLLSGGITSIPGSAQGIISICTPE